MQSVKSSDAAEVALRANKLVLVERLADDLAHEIKNPLHSMVINLEVLRRRIARSSADEVDDLLRYVGILSAELERTSARVDLMLRLVRPDRSSEPVSLSEALEELLALVELECQRQGVAITVDAPTTPPRTRLPHEVARQIVLNLLVSAIDAAGRGGSVRISASATDDHDRLAFAVTPAAPLTGGFPASPEESILAFSRSLIDAVGGRLEVAPDEGSDAAPTLLAVALPATG